MRRTSVLEKFKEIAASLSSLRSSALSLLTAACIFVVANRIDPF